MTETNTEDGAEFPRNHNLPPDIAELPSLPPEPTEEAVQAAVAALAPTEEPKPYDVAAHTAFAVKVSAFTAACGLWKDLKTISTQLQSEKLTDFISGARTIWGTIEAKRKEEKGFWDAKGKVVHADYTLLLDKLTRAVEDLKPLQADWLTRENARIAAEKAEAARIAKEKADEAARLLAQAEARNDVSGAVEAERLLAEAAKETKAAAKPGRAKAGSATGGGRAMSMRTVRSAEITNFNAVYMHFRTDPRVQALLQQLANEAFAAKGGSTAIIPGATMKTKEIAA